MRNGAASGRDDDDDDKIAVGERLGRPTCVPS